MWTFLYLSFTRVIPSTSYYLYIHPPEIKNISLWEILANSLMPPLQQPEWLNYNYNFIPSFFGWIFVAVASHSMRTFTGGCKGMANKRMGILNISGRRTSARDLTPTPLFTQSLSSLCFMCSLIRHRKYYLLKTTNMCYICTVDMWWCHI